LASWSHGREIADYSEAIRLDPKDAVAYRNLGFAYFNTGNFSEAAADLLRANDLAEDAYLMLWRFLARGRLKQDGAAELGASGARLKTKDWPDAVIDFYLGRRSLAEMNAAASKPEEKCEAAFDAGEWHVLRGKPSDAAAALKIAADTCPKGFIELAGAVAELKQLKP
jgi:lipoprotein NlpI